ncbi:MAG TPA: LysR family transcriptional regulator [Xanthobacteraceae bacterium]|jgi:DNA-binding transcriptional LysR family regulator
MDRFEAMSTLLSAVEAGSLSAASRKLGMPLATVSRKVSELEAHLRTRLVNRTSRRLTLTDAGRSYIVACKRILDDIGEAERAAAGEYIAPRGDLTITAPIVFGRLHVLPVAIEFLGAYPDVDIRVALADRVVNLQEDDVDLAIRIGELPDSSLIATRVGSIRRVICGSPAYFARRGTPKSPGELGAHDCISFEGLTSPDGWKFTVGKSTVSVAVRSRLVVNTAEAAVDAATAAVGVTRVLSYQVASALRAGTLALVLQRFEPPPWPVSLVHAGGGLLPLKLRAFLDFAAPRLKARLAQS